MDKWLAELDRLLRGSPSHESDLAQGRVGFSARRLVLLVIVLGALYGAAMGVYGGLGGRAGGWMYVLSGAVKVPLVFLLTLLVTFPSLYVFAALANSRLRARETLRLLIASIAVMLGVLASFAPVTLFFTVSTDSYRFMLFLNVLFFTIGGCVGLGFLNRAIAAVFRGSHREGTAGDSALPDGALQRPHGEGAERARGIFRLWLIIFAVVGAQMAFILRPFVGNPQIQFAWFRVRWSNVFEFLARSFTGHWQ